MCKKGSETKTGTEHSEERGRVYCYSASPSPVAHSTDWLIPKFRNHAVKERTDNYVERKGLQQVLRATFAVIRDSVKELVGKHMDSLAREVRQEARHENKRRNRFAWLK